MKAYRCDKCGQFRDGDALVIQWFKGDEFSASDEIDLCPDCAPAVIAPLVEIAKRTDE